MDNQLVNHELGKAGFLGWYRKYALDNETLMQLEAEARKAKRGLWADPQHTEEPRTVHDRNRCRRGSSGR
jgi:endonuclease YncB( thermonuclease family)